MASFIRGKQAGMQNDLSAGILPNLFAPEEQIRYGVASQISCLAYDPVQSLLAVGTTQSRFGRGTIYVFGQGRVHRVIQPKGGASLRQLQFSANRLVSLDAKSELALWNLDTGERVAGTVSAGPAAALATDPMLDWAFLGLTNGEVVAFDLDRERLSPLRIPNLWRTRADSSADSAPSPFAGGRARPRPPAATSAMATASMGLVSLQLHPRDAGKLLIGYSTGAVIYSFKHNLAVKYFEYVLPVGAPGGNGETPDVVRRPRLTQALWHPTGTFILTAHDDGSLVFWDPKDGRVVMARSLYAVGVDQPGAVGQPKPRLLDPFVQIAWCCKKNPDDTALLVAGGLAFDAPEKGLTFLELGPTPVYATSSWQMLSEHFRGKRQQLLAIPPGTEASGFCLAPRVTPYFDGASDPIAVFTLLNSGELLTLSFPSGFPISPTNQLHPSLTFVGPFVAKFAVATMARERWLGLTEARNTGEPLLRGGAEAPRPRRRYERRNIIQTGHADGTVRIWDVGHADEIENPALLQVDVARAVARDRDVEITALSLASATGELAVGTRVGEVVMFRWGTNKSFGSAGGSGGNFSGGPLNPGGFTDIGKRTEDTLQDGLQPWVLYEMLQGPVSVVGASDVGFVAAGSENGFLSIVDLRGPTVIFHGSLADFAKAEKRSSFLSSRHGGGGNGDQKKDYPVVVEFAVLSLEGKSYSSLVCLVGTQQGKVITFELLPSASGYTAKLAGMIDLKDKIVAICPIVAETGAPAAATGAAVAGLRNGQHVNGTLVVATQSEARIFRPAAAKGASKSFDDVFCYAASVVHMELHGYALVGVFGDGTTRAFTLPGLKEINRAPLAAFDATRMSDAVVAPSGDIFGWTGPSELIVVSSWGSIRAQDRPGDTLVNPDLAVPPRPTISNLQWISGTQYVSPLDLDLLIGGPDRPPSNRMMAAAAEEARIARHQGVGGGGGGALAGQRGVGGQEGWGQYLTRQFNERTEKLTFMSDSMDNLQEQSQGWADDVSKFVSNQKRSLVMGAVKSKFT